MTNYILNRGSTKVVGHRRLTDKLETVTAPIRQVAKYVSDQGYPISPSTIWHLFCPKQKGPNDNTQRGVIPARRASVVRSMHEWHARTAYSANRLSNCKQYICQGVEGGPFRGVTLHG